MKVVKKVRERLCGEIDNYRYIGYVGVCDKLRDHFKVETLLDLRKAMYHV